MDEYMSEKEKIEALRGYARQNGPWILARVLIAALGIAGWRLYQDHRDTSALAASAVYERMVAALEAGDRTLALSRLGELERDYPSSPYVDQGRLAAARLHVQNGELADAARRLEQVSTRSPDPELAQIARLRLARVQIAQGHPETALATLKGEPPKGFAPRWHEVTGDAWAARGDSAAALREYQAARTPEGASMVDTELLDLKIADLGKAPMGAPAVASGATPGPTPTTANTTAAAR